MKSIRVTLATLLGAASLSVAHGRVGWTQQQCIEKYGEPVGTRATLLEKSEGEAQVFKNADIEIIVEFRAGTVWMASYIGTEVSRKNVTKILANYDKAEADGGSGAKLVQDDSFFGQVHWNDANGDIHAVYYVSPRNMLVVFNTSARDATYKPKVWASERTEEEKDTGEGDPEDEKEKKPVPASKDPFDDF
jgi:hypothetical protein